MIYGIDGQFGSGKTSFATYVAKTVAITTQRNILKNRTISGSVILSNIKMNQKLMPNYFYMEDDKLLETLRSANCINDIERFLYGKFNPETGLTKWDRSKFSKFYIFFDESGALLNSQVKLKENDIYTHYLNQNRKNIQDIYISSAQGYENNKTIRSKIDWWYYVKPLFPFWIGNDIGIIRRRQLDVDGNIKMEKFVGKDQNGDYIAKERPIDQFVDWFYKPLIWNYYDDLHKNIPDQAKYTGMDIELFRKIIERKKELIPYIKDIPQLFDTLNQLSTPETEQQKIILTSLGR